LAVTLNEIEQRLRDYDGAADAEHLRLGEQERGQMLERFPRSAWPKMSLADYAIGQEDSSNTYCRWAEFNTPHLGSIRGGSSAKLIIYKHKNDPGWHYDEAAFDSVQDAWEAVRGQFVQAMALAGQGDWPAIEELPALRSGQALIVKTLHVYFRDKVLPISSREHLRHFLSLLGQADATAATAGAITLNQSLLTALRELSPERLTTSELERFLYRHYPPPTAAKWFKISPGSGARYWPECRAGGFICVGWDEVGDLRDYGSKDEFRAAFAQAWGAHYNNQAHVISKKANELWTLMEARPGDRIVANEGKSRILALGTVREPGYSFDPSREHFRHLVSVDWDESFAKEIPQQGAWLNTIDKVTLAQTQADHRPRPRSRRAGGGGRRRCAVSADRRCSRAEAAGRPISALSSSPNRPEIPSDPIPVNPLNTGEEEFGGGRRVASKSRTSQSTIKCELGDQSRAQPRVLRIEIFGAQPIGQRDDLLDVWPQRTRDGEPVDTGPSCTITHAESLDHCDQYAGRNASGKPRRGVVGRCWRVSRPPTLAGSCP